MSYQEKRTITSIVTGIAILAGYCIYAFGKVQAGAADPNDLKFWASSMLIFIGIGIVASIIIQIVFHILLSIGVAITKKIENQSCDDKDIEKSINAEMIEDEMDKLIELKAMRVGFFFAGIGMVSALFALVFGASAAVMLNIIFISFSAGSLVEGFTQIYFYRRGVRNG